MTELKFCRDTPGNEGETPREISEQDIQSEINAERRHRRLFQFRSLTVESMKWFLKGKQIGGQEWKIGRKRKADLIADCRWVV